LWQLRRLLKYRLLLDAGNPVETARSQARIRGKRNAAFHDRAAGTVTAVRLRELIHAAVSCDADLRSLPGSAHTMLLERLVYEIASPPSASEAAS
jgi:hypothetical protein